MGAQRSTALHEAIMELDAFIQSYWAEFSRDGVYGALIQAVYVDQDGNVQGQSMTANAPTDDCARMFRDFLFEAADGCEVSVREVA